MSVGFEAPVSPPSTVSPPKTLLDYYHEFARQEAELREGGLLRQGFAGQDVLATIS